MKFKINKSTFENWFNIGTFLVSVVFLIIWYFIWIDKDNFGIFDFFNKKGGVISVIFVIYMFSIPIMKHYLSKKVIEDNFFHLAYQQKDRIKILDKFEIPSNSLIDRTKQIFQNNRVIYNEIFNMLKRCSEEKDDEVSLKMLMCVPLIDNGAKINEPNFKWGIEFEKILKSIITADTSNKINLEITYLPNKYIFGVNPFKEFIESISGFYSEKHNIDAEIIFENIYKQTTDFIEDLERESEKRHITIKEISEIDVPFQIFLYSTKKYKEVIVSFASKTILQDKNIIEHKGFHSVDDDVVFAFENIYSSYTTRHRRNPIKPVYSSEKVKKIRKEKKHKIENYFNLGINIDIETNMFSPAIANSAKFVSKVIIDKIQGDINVLDIGSGSGIQAIVAYKTMVNNGINKPNIYAIEPFSKSFELLEKNIEANNISHIKTYQYELGCKKKNNQNKFQYVSVIKSNINKMNDCIGSLIKYNSSSNYYKPVTFNSVKFDLIIADLPFVDTKPSNNDLEFAFYDLDHNTHKCLFSFFANDKMINKNAKLVTTFSTLSGLDDIIVFEKLISNYKLSVIQRYSFTEDNYLWYVYVIVKENQFNNNYWLEKFNIQYSKENGDASS